MTTLEPARMEEVNVCMEIIKEGKKFQEEQGFTQWTEDYPDKDTIRSDIRKTKGYVLKMDDEIAGYMCIDFDGEPAYDDIQGRWRTEEPYAVIHRMAFRKEFRGIGLTDITFGLIEDLCIQNGIHCIRVDTDFSNKRMQHIFKKNGFENCGRIIFQGSEKLAYDKWL
mgnify:CR=1 FL=1